MKNGAFAEYKIFTGNAHPALAEEIASIMGKPLGKVSVNTFSDGEISVDLWETVRGVDCYIVQPTCDPVNNSLMELLIMIDAMKRASAGRINAVSRITVMPGRTEKQKPETPLQPNWLLICWWLQVQTEWCPWTFMHPRFRAILISR